MKKTLCLLLTVFLCLCAFASGFDNRDSAMGFTGADVSDRQNNSFYNPASLYFYNNQSDFIVKLSGGDDFADKEPFSVEKPHFGLSGKFIAKYISLSIDLAFDAQRLTEDSYNMAKTVGLGLDAAAGFDNVSAGIGVYLYSEKARKNVEVGSSRILLDLIEKGILNEFSRDDSESGARVKAGLGYMHDSFSAGIIFDDFINASTASSKRITWMGVLNSIGAGLGYNTSRYSTRGKLNKWVFGIEADAFGIFSGNPFIHGGLDLTFQFVRNWTISLRGGVRLPVFASENGISTYGLGLRMGDFDLSAALTVPFACYVSPVYEGVSGTIDLTVLL